MRIGYPSSSECSSRRRSRIVTKVYSDVASGDPPGIIAAASVNCLYIFPSLVSTRTLPVTKMVPCRNSVLVPATVVSAYPYNERRPDLKRVTCFNCAAIQAFCYIDITFSKVNILGSSIFKVTKE
jgi:hypothetical protein